MCFGLDPGAEFTGTPEELSATSFGSEVAKTTLLKADHGGGGGWPASCGQGGCANGFERKMPDCDGCDNDFIMNNPSGIEHNGVDNLECECDLIPQLDATFAVLHSGSKDQVAGVMNITAAFIYQAMLVINANIDSGDHNCKSLKSAEQILITHIDIVDVFCPLSTAWLF